MLCLVQGDLIFGSEMPLGAPWGVPGTSLGFPGVGPLGIPNLHPSGLEGSNVWSRGASKLGSQGFLEVSLEVRLAV